MKSIKLRWVIPILLVGAVLLLIVLIKTGSKHPVAVIRVVDSAGNPIAGAVIKPDGLRPKPGDYSGHYSWTAKFFQVPPDPAVTDGDGCAAVPYPKYVFERIETGQISFSVNHPDFVPERPFRVVTTTPPAGAPWRKWADYLWDRIRHNAFIVRTDPVVLQKGAVLKLSVRSGTEFPKEAQLFAQVSKESSHQTNFWSRPQPDVLLTRRLAAGKQAIRAFQVRPDRSIWFGQVVTVTAAAGLTNEVTVDLEPGLKVSGRLDPLVPRPIGNGRVIVHVWPEGYQPAASPPQWHAWTTIHDDGSFTLTSLPPGDLEIVALCDGLISTNGLGSSSGMRYPQKHKLGPGDLNLTIGMEPTARLEVQVSDDKGNPLPGAVVGTWPNVRYGDWGATIFAGDCFNTVDWFTGEFNPESAGWARSVPDFQGTSDSAGLAVVPNLPVDVTEFSVEHSGFVLPAVTTSWGEKSRSTRITLHAGRTNRVSVRLEPRERSPISQY